MQKKKNVEGNVHVDTAWFHYHTMFFSNLWQLEMAMKNGTCRDNHRIVVPCQKKGTPGHPTRPVKPQDAQSQLPSSFRAQLEPQCQLWEMLKISLRINSWIKVFTLSIWHHHTLQPGFTAAFPFCSGWWLLQNRALFPQPCPVLSTQNWDLQGSAQVPSWPQSLET